MGETSSPRQQLPCGRPFSDVCSSDPLSRAGRGSLLVLRRALLGASLPHRDGRRGKTAGLDIAALGVGDGGWSLVWSCGNVGETNGLVYECGTYLNLVYYYLDMAHGP